MKYVMDFDGVFENSGQWYSQICWSKIEISEHVAMEIYCKELQSFYKKQQ